MNILETIDRLITVLDKAIFGVIIGALLTPFISRIIERGRRKQEIKIELVKTINEIYNYFKQYAHNNTFASYYMTRGNINANKTEEADKQQAILDHGRSDEFDSRNQELFSKVYALESQLSGLIVEVQSYYGKSKYQKLDPIIMTIIEQSNDESYIAGNNFQGKTEDELDNLQVGDFIRPIQEKMDKDSYKYRNKVLEIL